MTATSFPEGISDAEDGTFAARSGLPLPDPDKFVQFYDEFTQYTLNDIYTLTFNPGGGSIEVLDTPGSPLRLTTPATVNAFVQAQVKAEIFEYLDSREFWISTRVTQGSDTVGVFVGVSETSADCRASANNLYYGSTTTTQVPRIQITGNSSTTQIFLNDVTIVQNVPSEIGMHYIPDGRSGRGRLEVFQDGRLIRTVLNTEYTNPVSTMAPFINVTTQGAINTGDVDWLQLLVARS